MESKGSKTKEAREQLKAISAPLKKLVKEGKYETLNEAIVTEKYTDENNKVFKRFKDWVKEGKKIKKGSKGFPVWGKPRKTQEKESEEEYEFFPVCFLFSNAQTLSR